MGSRIEAGLTIEGSVRGEGELTVAGRLRGVLTLQGTLVIEEGGAVEAEVEAGAVVVAGLLSGSVTAHEELRVLPGGCVDARVRAARLAMAEGAIFRGELQAAVAPALPASAVPTAQRLAARATPQQLPQTTHAADAIPPIPTLNKSPHAHTQVAAPPPPVPGAAVRHSTINPPPPAAPSAPRGARAPSPSPAAYDDLEPTPTTPAPAFTNAAQRPSRGTIPPAPRVPDLARDDAPTTLPKPVAPASQPRARAAFAAPPTKGRKADEPAPEAPAETKPRARDRNAQPRMPALPQKRSNMSRRGGG